MVWRRALAGAVFSLIAGQPASASDAADDIPKLTGTPVKQSGTSTIEIKRYGADRLIPRTRRVGFHVFRGLTPMLLLREQIDVEDVAPWKGEGWEVARVELTANVLASDGSTSAKPKYRIREEGQDATLYDSLYVVKNEGCCDSQNGFAVYSVETGKRLMYTTGGHPPGALEFISSLDSSAAGNARRWVGVFAANSAYAERVFDKRPENLAMVTYASDQAPLVRVLITSPIAPHTQQPYFDRLEVKKAHGNAGEKPRLTLHVQFYEGVFIDLPIVNDTLDAKQAKASAGVAARVVPLDAEP